MTAEDLGWGEPGTAVRAEIVTATCGGAPIRLPVRRQIVPLVAGLVADLERSRGEPFRADWSWGYAHRRVRGSSTTWSNHAWGLAIDLDAPENPMTTSTSASHEMPSDAGAIARRWGFRWGGEWRPRRDYMHFELALTPAQAAKLIAELRALAGRPHPAPPSKPPPSPPPHSHAPPPHAPHAPPFPGRILRRGVKGGDVRMWQAKMRERGWRRMGVDGDYGPMSAELCTQFQREKRLSVDGMVGSQTWTATWR